MSRDPLQADRRAQQLRKLTEVSRALTYAVSLGEVLELAVSRAALLLEAPRAVLMLTDEQGLLSVRASYGVDRASSERFREPLRENLITRLGGLLGQGPDEQFLGVPLVVAGEVTGLLAVARPADRASVDEDEWLLSALADQAAVALEKTRLDESAEFRERLIGIVSHDLRNPIAAILLGAQSLLRRDELDERSTKVLARIQSSAERAQRMVRDLLDFTQARLGGGIHVERRAADLQAIVTQVVEELEVTHPDGRIQVSHQGDGRGEWDVDRLAQVVGNLVSNALDYSPPDTEVRVATQAEEGWVSLQVHNGGPPIPAERLARLFEPMQRTERDTSRRSVGLGLYIVKHIVEAHGGGVSVRSTDGEGTTLTVRLPRAARA